MTISKQVRTTIVAHISANTSYDPDTVRISSDGLQVTAKRDQNKTAECDNNRYLVGSVTDILRDIDA